MSDSHGTASAEAHEPTIDSTNTLENETNGSVAIADVDKLPDGPTVTDRDTLQATKEQDATSTHNSEQLQKSVAGGTKERRHTDMQELEDKSAAAQQSTQEVSKDEQEVLTDQTSETADTAIKHEDVIDYKRQAIQDEAIRHLARRASEMTLSSAQIQSPVAVHKDAKLPATPPPPSPPIKESSMHKPVLQPGFNEKQPAEDTSDLPEGPQGMSEQAGEEIQHIIEQFDDTQAAPGEEEIMSPILERQQPILQLPPRSSSLESGYGSPFSAEDKATYFATAGSKRNSVISQTPGNALDDGASIKSRTSVFQPPPPSPDAETALPFDFHRFLEQLRHRTADPVARFLRSFLQEFGKKQWMAHEQVKIISDFLEFISKKMAQCEVWRTVSDAEFDNAREGMEKLVMNRLYTQTFSPAIAPAANSPRKGGKARSAAESSSSGPGRRGQHQEDVERDDVIAQKLKIYGWIKEEHLDIKPIGEKGKKFLTMAQQELLKINTYRAPRDKVICVLNCCKVIFGFLKNSKSDQSADAFVPLLIYTVLQARPEHLVSNVQYIWRFRNQDKLGGEAGYYMSSLMGVVQFVENLDRTMITITDEEFESHVEQAVSAITERHKQEQYEEQTHGSSGPSTPRSAMTLSEKSSISRPEVTARNSAQVSQTSPRRQKSIAGPIEEEDNDAMSGLLRTIQKPLSSIGRIFSDESNTDTLRPSSPLPPRTSSRGLSPAARTDRSSSRGRKSGEQRRVTEADVRQASVESAEMQRERQRGIAVVVETLQGMFPNLEKEIIEDVVRSQEGNVGRAVDACLALSDQG